MNHSKNPETSPVTTSLPQIFAEVLAVALEQFCKDEVRVSLKKITSLVWEFYI